MIEVLVLWFFSRGCCGVGGLMFGLCGYFFIYVLRRGDDGWFVL